MTYTPQQLAAIRAAGRAVVDAVRAAGDLGAPAGVVYAALMHAGCTLSQFHGLVGGLIRGGYLDRRGDLLFVTAKLF